MNDFQQQRDDAELVGCKLAYEAGVHWLDANVRALEALRTRSLALMSVMLLAATFVAGVREGRHNRNGDNQGGDIGSLGIGWPLVVRPLYDGNNRARRVRGVDCQVHCRVGAGQDHQEARRPHLDVAVNRPSRTASHGRARVRLQESPARCAALWATESSSTASAGIVAATANTAVSPSFRPSDMSCAANPPNAESSSSVRSSWCSIHVAWSTAPWRARGLLPFGAPRRPVRA